MKLELTVSELAFAFQASRDTVRKRLADQDIKPAGKRRGTAVFDLREVVPALTGGPDGDPFRRRAQRQAELLELQIATKRGQLVDRFAMERELARNHTLTLQALEILPDVLERDCGASAAQLECIEKEIDRLRQSLYEKLVDGETPEEEADERDRRSPRAVRARHAPSPPRRR